MTYPDLKGVKIIKTPDGKIVEPDNRNLTADEALPEAIENTLEVFLDNWIDLS